MLWTLILIVYPTLATVLVSNWINITLKVTTEQIKEGKNFLSKVNVLLRVIFNGFIIVGLLAICEFDTKLDICLDNLIEFISNLNLYDWIWNSEA